MIKPKVIKNIKKSRVLIKKFSSLPLDFYFLHFHSSQETAKSNKKKAKITSVIFDVVNKNNIICVYT